jgi:hypothetical protein
MPGREAGPTSHAEIRRDRDRDPGARARQQVAALAHLIEAQAATKGDIAGLEVRLVEMEGRLRGEIGRDIATVRGEIAAAKVDTIRWVVGFGVVQIASVLGLAFAILRLFPGARP